MRSRDIGERFSALLLYWVFSAPIHPWNFPIDKDFILCDCAQDQPYKGRLEPFSAENTRERRCGCITGRGFGFARSLSTRRQCVLAAHHHSPLRHTPGKRDRATPSGRTRSLRIESRFPPVRPVRLDASPGNHALQAVLPYRIPGRRQIYFLQGCRCKYGKTGNLAVCKGMPGGCRTREAKEAELRTLRE